MQRLRSYLYEWKEYLMSRLQIQTKKLIFDKVQRSITALENEPKTFEADRNMSESFLPLSSVHIPTVKEFIKTFKSDAYRLEIGIAFANGDNIQTDVLFIEVYER